MTKLTFTSITTGGQWGQRGRVLKTGGPGESSALLESVEPDEESAFVKNISTNAKSLISNDISRDAKSLIAGLFQNDAVMRAYLDLLKSAQDLEEALKTEGVELDLGCGPSKLKNGSRATFVCLLISVVVAAVFVGTAALMAVWGFHVNGRPAANVTAIQAYADGKLITFSESNVTCSVEMQDGFQLDKFLGWPDERVFWNLYGGLVLGLVFGFLDNFGLFYGMGALDSSFYALGSKVAAGVMRIFGPNVTSARQLFNIHVVTTDLMAGLGNTFSDLLGVALGTAALEIAKAGLNTDPAFWVLDLLAIVLGCLLGCFMPVLIKHKEILGGDTYAPHISKVAWSNIVGLFTAVFLTGVPYKEAHVVSFVIICINIIFLVLMLAVTLTVGTDLLKKARSSISDPSNTLRI